MFRKRKVPTLPKDPGIAPINPSEELKKRDPEAWERTQQRLRGEHVEIHPVNSLPDKR